MDAISADCQRISLEGDWSIENVAGLHKFLAARRAEILQAEPAPSRVAIDLSGMATVDACGSQLLAVFLEELRRHGITPRQYAAPQQVMDQIAMLGFVQYLAPQLETEKEPA